MVPPAVADVSWWRRQAFDRRTTRGLQRICFPTLDDAERFKAVHYRRHLEIFPTDKFVGLDGDAVVGSRRRSGSIFDSITSITRLRTSSGRLADIAPAAGDCCTAPTSACTRSSGAVASQPRCTPSGRKRFGGSASRARSPRA